MTIKPARRRLCDNRLPNRRPAQEQAMQSNTYRDRFTSAAAVAIAISCGPRPATGFERGADPFEAATGTVKRMCAACGRSVDEPVLDRVESALAATANSRRADALRYALVAMFDAASKRSRLALDLVEMAEAAASGKSLED